jgi:hypothetical protein
MYHYITDDHSFAHAYTRPRPFRLKRYVRMGWSLCRRSPRSYLGATLLAIGGYLLAAGLATGVIWLSAGVPFLNGVVILVAYFMRYAFGFALSAGFFAMSRRLHQEHLAEFNDAWAGVRAFWQIGTAKAIQLLLMAVPMLVILLLAGIRSYDELVVWAEQDLISPVEILRFYHRELRLLGLTLVPYVLIHGLYLFTTPLILLGRLQFSTAMEVSRKIVLSHGWGVIRLLLVIAGLSALSALTLGLGLLIALPLIYTTVYAAYADLTQPEGMSRE